MTMIKTKTTELPEYFTPPTGIDEARKWIQNWRNKNPHAVTAFLIPAENLKILLGLLDHGENLTITGYVRAYLGRKLAAEEDELNNDEDCLLLVPTTHVSGSTGRNGYYKDDWGTRAKPQIYDFTFPCPSTCDPISPLHDLLKSVS